MVVIGVARSGNRLSRLVFLKPEWAGAHDFLLEPVRIAIEDLFLVEEGVRIGEGGQECARREFEAEDDGFWIARFDFFDHRIIAAAWADDAVRRVDDVVPARRHIIGGHRRTILEPDVRSEERRVGKECRSRWSPYH